MQDKGGHDAKFLANYETKQNSYNTRLSAVLNLIQFQMVNRHVKKIFTKVFFDGLLILPKLERTGFFLESQVWGGDAVP
jgi:hypothetical protein